MDIITRPATAAPCARMSSAVTATSTVSSFSLTIAVSIPSSGDSLTTSGLVEMTAKEDCAHASASTLQDTRCTKSNISRGKEKRGSDHGTNLGPAQLIARLDHRCKLIFYINKSSVPLKLCVRLPSLLLWYIVLNNSDSYKTRKSKLSNWKYVSRGTRVTRNIIKLL